MQPLEFNPSDKELAAMRSELFRGFTDVQFDLCIEECKRRNLVPGQHIHFSLRSSKEYDPELKTSAFVKKIVRITTIDAMRLIAQRSGEYEGQGKAVWYYLDDEGEPTITSTIPLADKKNRALPREPWAASIPVYRKGLKEPVEVVARFDAYAQLRKSDNGQVLTEVWQKRMPEQIAKCSAVAALRAGWAEELGKLYIKEELDKEDDNTPSRLPDPMPTVAAPAALVVPTVNSAPVEATAELRPNEVAPKPPVKRTAKKAEPAPEPVQIPDESESTIMASDVAKAVQEIREQKKAEPISDNDLPDELFGDTPTAEEKPAEEERLPTQEEKVAFGEEIRSYTRIDRQNLKEFILRENKQNPKTGDIKLVTKQAYERALGKLKEAQKAKDNGQADAFDKLFF